MAPPGTSASRTGPLGVSDVGRPAAYEQVAATFPADAILACAPAVSSRAATARLTSRAPLLGGTGDGVLALLGGQRGQDDIALLLVRSG